MGTAIDKYLSKKAVSKSDNKDVHLSALKVMPSIIENSIVGEVHEDKKGDRHLKDVVRLYGAIGIDGQSYRVKTTVKRYNSKNEKSKAYSYEVTEIELLEGTHGDDNNGELPRSGNNAISTAKLLNISETAKNNSQETEREDIAQRDKEYAEAVAAGDKEKIDAMLREEMRRKGYADNSDYQGSKAFNGAAPSSNAYFETREERKEAFDNGELEGDFSLEDFMEAGIDTHDLEWQLANPIAASARDKATLESINNLRSAVRGKKKTIKIEVDEVELVLPIPNNGNKDW